MGLKTEQQQKRTTNNNLLSRNLKVVWRIVNADRSNIAWEILKNSGKDIVRWGEAH